MDRRRVITANRGSRQLGEELGDLAQREHIARIVDAGFDPVHQVGEAGDLDPAVADVSGGVVLISG
jgi:hypothetical protein